MCGRFTVKATWAEIVALYRLTMEAPPHNLRPRYNVCPTDPVDVVTGADGKRELVNMRWVLVPWWWSKPPHALPDPDVGLLRMARHAGRQAALVFHGA
jgi:putative SOS response-associated peptidase YedK